MRRGVATTIPRFAIVSISGEHLASRPIETAPFCLSLFISFFSSSRSLGVNVSSLRSEDREDRGFRAQSAHSERGYALV
jgi:hypothetical protein